MVSKSIGEWWHILSAGLPTLCLKKVLKLCDVLNVRVAAGHWPTQAQEKAAGTGALFPFLFRPTEFFCKIE